MQLLQLKATGKTEIEIPESLFDRAYPGHYMRRLKSVTMTIPGITGPYGGVNCTLTMLSSKIRRDTRNSDSYAESGSGNDDDRFIYNYGAISSVCTSSGQNDGGVFELNFRDERYLPFEGAGAVSRWRIEMPQETNELDLGSVTDVVLHLNYTAREGGSPLKEAALAHALTEGPRTVVRLFSLRNELEAAWTKFEEELLVDGTEAHQVLEASFEPMMPFLPGKGALRATKLMIAAVWRDGVAHLGVSVTSPAETALEITVPPAPTVGSADLGPNGELVAGVWTITIPDDTIRDLPAELKEDDGFGNTRIKTSELLDLLVVLVADREGTP